MTGGPGYDGVAMPSARPSVVEGLAVEEGRDGLAVFDPATDRVHYLNATAAIVFTLCHATVIPGRVRDPARLGLPVPGSLALTRCVNRRCPPPRAGAQAGVGRRS